MLTESPSNYVERDDWLGEFRGARLVRTIQWGVITERRFAMSSGLEVDLAVGPLGWASVQPLDPGTRRVVRDGMRVLYDPDGLLAALAAVCEGS